MPIVSPPVGHDTSLYIPELKTRKKEPVLHELARFAHEVGIATEPGLLHETLVMRERVGLSSLGKGVALPNARSVVVREARLLVARSRRGVDWGSDDGPVHLVLLALSPAGSSEETHRDWVARIAALGRQQRHRLRLLEAESVEEITVAVREGCA